MDTTSTPDVDGTIYLDTASFQVTRVRVDLTHPDALSRRRPKAYTAVTVMYHFAEIAPAVRVLDFMLGRNSLRAGSVRGGVVAETQEQHIVVFQFTKEAPSGAPKQP